MFVKKLKLISIVVTSLMLTACVNMDGKMVNYEGKKADCSTSGGGFGLGMVVGAAIAATNNQLCESKWEDKGFILAEDVGMAGIDFNEDASKPPLIVSVKSPASQCVKSGDLLLSVDGVAVSNILDAKMNIFRASGTELLLALSREEKLSKCPIILL